METRRCLTDMETRRCLIDTALNEWWSGTRRASHIVNETGRNPPPPHSQSDLLRDGPHRHRPHCASQSTKLLRHPRLPLQSDSPPAPDSPPTLHLPSTQPRLTSNETCTETISAKRKTKVWSATKNALRRALRTERCTDAQAWSDRESQAWSALKKHRGVVSTEKYTT